MSNILNLEVKIKKDIDATIDSISGKLNGTWTRDIKAEVSVKEAGSKQYAFNYKKGEKNNSIFLIERDGKLESTNIVPQGGLKSISHSECNKMIRKFEKDVLQDTGLKYSIHNS